MDFSSLTNEQMLDLMKGLMQESINRNITTAAREVLLTEKEKQDIKDLAERRAKERAKEQETARISREAYEKEENRLKMEQRQQMVDEQQRLWNLKKKHAEALTSLLGEVKDYWINVWNGSDKRVYINTGEPFSKKAREVSVYFVTGNSRNKPGKLEKNTYLFPDQDITEQYTALMKEIASAWVTVKFSVKEALAYEPVN